MNNFAIDIDPNGQTLRLVLKAEIVKTPLVGKPYTRPLINSLDGLQKDLRILRFGDAPDQLVKNVTAKISEWFLSSDLNERLEMAVNNSRGGEPMRVIFSINDEGVLSDLADVPFELMTLKDSPDPLVLSPCIASFIHVLPRVGAVSSPPSNWPLKVLIVRSNPKDLGGAIPGAEQIRQAIREIMEEEPALNPDLVRVDVLSSENAASFSGRPTIEGLTTQLLRVQYDILMYVGHGDVSSDTTQGQRVGGVLQLEDETGNEHRVLQARSLASKLREPNPVPVVLLLGCLTAAEDIPEDQREGVRELIPDWVRGSQGVAQVLINSESGVQLVVGTRYQIDTQNAVDYSKSFFRNLLKIMPGNVEAAVRAGRRKLEDKTYMWSAPVVFSTLSKEPLFPFMEDRPECPTFESSQTLRNSLWKNLSKVNWNLREQAALRTLVDDWHVALSDCEMEVGNEITTQRRAMISPGFLEVRPDEEVRIPVRILGTLKGVEEIEGRINIGGGQVKITSLEPAANLTQQNYQLASMDNNSGFLIRRNEASGGSLETGDLFTIVLKVPPAGEVVLPISISKIKTKPLMTICPGDNAIVVPPL